MEGKVVWITGASSGIGEALAYDFARKGAKLVLSARRETELTRVKVEGKMREEDVLILPLDIEKTETFTAAFQSVIARSGTLDIVVNNAGISHIGNIEKTSVEDFERLFNVNAKGTFLTMKTALPLMTESGGGSVVNIASTAAMAGVADRFAFSMSKAAVVGMTLSFARDYIARNIRCNCISQRTGTP